MRLFLYQISFLICLFNQSLTLSSPFTDYAVEEKPSQISVMQQLEDGGPDPLVFVLNANLLSMVKIVNCKLKICFFFFFYSSNFILFLNFT